MEERDILEIIKHKLADGYTVIPSIGKGENGRVVNVGGTKKFFISVPNEETYKKASALIEWNETKKKVAERERKVEEAEKAEKARRKYEARRKEAEFDVDTLEAMKMVNKGYNARTQGEGRIQRTINGINGREDRANKPNIKSKPKTSSKKKREFRRKLAGVAAILTLALGVAGITRGCNGRETPEPTEITTSYTDVNKIKTVKGVEEDFVCKYLERYNKEFETEYNQYEVEMIVNSLRDGMAYETPNGDIVTRGSNPEQTEQKLREELGGCRLVSGYDKVVQIVTDKGEILGTYDMSSGKFIYSGNQLKDLTDKSFEASTLNKLGINKEKLEAAGKAILSENVEDRNSVDKRINAYKSTEFDSKEKAIDDAEMTR